MQPQVQFPAGESISTQLLVALCVRLDGLRATQHRTNPRQQLAQPERFGDVVVGGELQAHHEIGLFGFAAENQDRDRGALAHASRESEPVLTREAQVEQEQVDRLVGNDAQHFGAARDSRDAQVLGAEVLNEDIPDIRIVVKGQHVRSDGLHMAS